LYVIGGYIPHHQPAHSDFLETTAVVEQYVPIGYRSSAYTTPTPSSPATTSEPAPSRPYSTYLIIVVTLTITTITIGTSLFFYFRKRKRGVTGDVAIFDLSKPLT